MKSFKVDFQLGDKLIKITPYNTAMEKDLLLMASFDIENLDDALKILNFDEYNEYKVEDLSYEEKVCILYKFRELSIGSEVEIKFKCQHCGLPNDGVLDISDNIVPASRNDKNIKKLNIPVTDDNLSNFLPDEIDVDELEIDKYDELFERVKNNQISYNFVKTCKCIKCRKENEFIINSAKTVLEYLSEDNLMSLYKTYNNMIFFGKMSKVDIDTMYPFERTVFVGLINKTKEELAKK